MTHVGGEVAEVTKIEMEPREKLVRWLKIEMTRGGLAKYRDGGRDKLVWWLEIELRGLGEVAEVTENRDGGREKLLR